MLLSSRVRLCTGAAAASAGWGTPVVPAVAPPAVLDVVRKDPGQTSMYYATRYFGGVRQSAILNFVLWSELKRFGLVMVERPDGPSGEARWVPAAFAPPRRSRVRLHNAEEEDLSVLNNHLEKPSVSPSSSAAFSVDAVQADPVAAITQRLGPLVLSLVGAFPQKDLPYYLRQFHDEQDRALAPVVFKQLRLEGKLARSREVGSTGTFVWSLTAVGSTA